jgi:hypothetical protein
MFFLIGCTYTNNPNDKLEVTVPEGSDTEVLYEFSHGITGYNFETWQYDGDAFEFEYDIENMRSTLELGLVILIDGIVQEYTVDNELYSMYKVNLSKEEVKDFSISLEPNTGKANNSYIMHCMVVVEPSKTITDVRELVLNHSISLTAPVEIQFLNDAKEGNIVTKEVATEKTPIPIEELQEYIHNEHDLLVDHSYLRIYENGELSFGDIHRESKIELAAFGVSGEYRVLMVEDTVVTNHFDITIDTKMYTTFSIPVIQEKTNSLYFILVPRYTNNNGQLNQSERLVVK